MLSVRWDLWAYRWGLLRSWFDHLPYRLRHGTAHPEVRCVMGGPVHPMAHCPRPATPDGGLWCEVHG